MGISIKECLKDSLTYKLLPAASSNLLINRLDEVAGF
jgi:hypothetical protein